MYFELDYYADPSRGAVPLWRNEMAELSWLYWLTFDGLSAAGRVSTPTLFVHSDDCVLPDNAHTVHNGLAGPKQLVWAEGGQTDFYDRPDHVALAVDAAPSTSRRPCDWTYTDLWGGEPAEIAADDLVEQWQGLLPGSPRRGT
ncbi:hypothetical protein EV193_101435 [Herbihabitans rhizosphaerae]|uniref:Alpha/beta hydrolase family protein n=1 Tax=Herbihabitans rhizosphaerae TaxID=1872711 RepID=A0A4Q7L4K4_9PSEU|nr:hypothetical protein [Herbihabitans rhizosphaerae]RZS44559.1 hypothetical protein EV193_101435 [Herbihabitans rhizosphaerae]